MPSTTIAGAFGGFWRHAWTTLGRAAFSLSGDAADSGSRSATIDPWAIDLYGTYENRTKRYAMGLAYYENTAHDKIHRWAEQANRDFNLAPGVHNVFNPARRVVDFWANHLYCGTIDPLAGDGSKSPSAVPIECDDSIRPALARVLVDSQFDILKTVYGRLGAMLGDVGLYAVNDPLMGRAYMEVIHPSSIVEYDADPTGIPNFYAIEEQRIDPRREAKPGSRCTFREEGRLVGGKCEFRTFISANDAAARNTTAAWEPYDWSDHAGAGSTWTEDYPFVPLVLATHSKVLPRCPFGQAEITPILSKIRELDDTASRFGEFVGKAVDPVWLLKGIRLTEYQESMAELGLIRGGKSGIPAIASADTQAAAQPMLAPLNLADVCTYLTMLMDEVKDELPELRRDIESATGDSSGTALRVAQQRIETKAQAVRAGYDHALALALGYCVRMGGMMGYDGYEAIGTTPDPAKLTIRIANRPVFKASDLDNLIRDEKFWAVAESADRSGCPLPAFLEMQGWTADRIAAVVDARDEAIAKGLPVGRSKQASPNTPAAALAIQAPGGAAP